MKYTSTLLAFNSSVSVYIVHIHVYMIAIVFYFSKLSHIKNLFLFPNFIFMNKNLKIK